MDKIIYTVGHSSHSIEHFVSLLRRFQITALCDVRSVPRSRHNPQFDQDEIGPTLRHEGIRYVFLGKELGARSEDPQCYVAGKVQYDRLVKTGPFKRGIDRVLRGSDNYVLALMCAEKEPTDCHRTILVGKRLVELGFDIVHILANGESEPNKTTVERLRRMAGLHDVDFFLSDADVVEHAYRAQAEKIAYVKSD